ncbi:MAG TPA: Gfo/Idh/MocA family oxidoreductase [Polyangiaceae bacterium]|nr:Gfo/Idh/MocA family oxidoreductase [Polyangiaceae bacterium]
MRVLVIGHGLIGKQRARALAALEKSEQHAGLRLAGTVDPLPRAAELYPSAPHFADLAQVPEAAFDAAVIALPHHLAAEAAKRVLSAGKPILIEKPLGLNAAGAKEIAHLAERVSRPSFVGYNYRFLPTMQKVFERLRDGSLGELRSVDMMIGHGGHPRSTEDWKLRPEQAGGGVLIDPGVHLLDLALQVAPDLVCSAASATRGFWKTGIEEDVSAILTTGRTICSVRVSLIRWVNTFRLEFVGEDGYALVDGRGGTYGAQTLRLGRRWGWNDGSGRSQRATEEVFDFGPANVSLDDEMSAVALAWLTGKASAALAHPATIAEAVSVAELCDSMYKKIG